jgi:hypothetical protein
MHRGKGAIGQFTREPLQHDPCHVAAMSGVMIRSIRHCSINDESFGREEAGMKQVFRPDTVKRFSQCECFYSVEADTRGRRTKRY